MKRLRFNRRAHLILPSCCFGRRASPRPVYRYGAIALDGVLYKREETRTFLAVVYNHGSAASMLSQEAFEGLGPAHGLSASASPTLMLRCRGEEKRWNNGRRGYGPAVLAAIGDAGP